ncbi:MAG: hypothetical protein GY723_09465 [bacterium]|nr:hypothetical protein [bacterium]
MSDPSVQRGRLPEWLAKLILLAVSVGFALVLFEVGARLFVRAWTPQHGVRNFWRPDPALGWVHVPSARGRHVHHDFDVEVATSQQGFRDDTVSLERVKGRRRVLFLGDSFGFGYGVERGELLPDLLEERFADTEFVNASVAGWGTDQQLLFFRQQGYRYSPDVVLYLFHPNDVEDNNAARRYRYPKPQFIFDSEGRLELTGVPVPALSLREKFGRFLQQQTFAIYRVWDWRDQLRTVWQQRQTNTDAPPAPPAAPERPTRASTPVAAAAATVPGGPKELDGPTRPPKPGRNQDFRISRALIEALHEETQRHDARLAIVSIGGAPDPRELLTQTLLRLGVPYLPLDEAFANHRGIKYKFQHDPHWNPTGHVLAADAVERWLIDEKIL